MSSLESFIALARGPVKEIELSYPISENDQDVKNQ